MIEQYQPPAPRLFNDPVIEAIVAWSIKAAVRFSGVRTFFLSKTEAIAEGTYGVLICRVRYDDDVIAARDVRGNRSVGDSRRRPRHPCLSSTSNRQDASSKSTCRRYRRTTRQSARYLGGLPSNVTFLPVDFNTDSLEGVLARTLFDWSKRVVFIWEGVTQSISEDAVRRTFSFAGKSAPGRKIAFTYVVRGVIDGSSDIPGAQRLMTEVAKQGAPWIFGLDPQTIGEHLAPFHLALTADVGSVDYQARYLQPTNRKLTVSECERIAEVVVR